MNILVVCHGSINRSPLSAAVLRKHLPVKGFSVKVAGFVNPGRRATAKMREQALRLGYSLEEHRSQLVTPQLLSWADKIVYMDGGNLKRLRSFSGFVEEKGVCLGEYCNPPVMRIRDPNFMRRGSEELIAVVDQLFGASRALAACWGR